MNASPPIYEDDLILTADIVVIVAGIWVLTVKRVKWPYQDMFVLPGGKWDASKDLRGAQDTARRELGEETGYWLPEQSLSRLIYIATYDTPGRDPRGNYTSVAFLLQFDTFPELLGGNPDEVSEYSWFSLESLPTLGFDHNQIVVDAKTLMERR